MVIPSRRRANGGGRAQSPYRADGGHCVCYKAKRSSKGASDAVKAMPTGNSRIHANIEKLLLKQPAHHIKRRMAILDGMTVEKALRTKVPTAKGPDKRYNRTDLRYDHEHRWLILEPAGCDVTGEKDVETCRCGCIATADCESKLCMESICTSCAKRCFGCEILFCEKCIISWHEVDMTWCRDCALYVDSLCREGASDRNEHVSDEDDAAQPQKRAKSAHGLNFLHIFRLPRRLHRQLDFAE